MKMCSIEEDTMEGSLLENLLITEKKIDATCRKCTTEEASVVLQRKFSYCKSCFLQLVNHKFRATIGKLKLKQMSDRILVVFSENQSSIALLHLLQSGMNEKNHKKLKFHVDVLVIDDSILWPKDIDSQFTMSQVSVILKQFPFNRFIVKLSDLYKEKLEIKEFEEFLPPDEFNSRMQGLFNVVKSNTSKIDLLSKLRTRISYECAELLKCNKIFTPECATHVAIRLLSNTTLRRCANITYDSAICDDRNPAIHCIRPLREVTSKEIAFYNVFNGLDSAILPSSAMMFSSSPSLQWESLMFISNLQEEFPSTVYTVFNVGDKLTIPRKIEEHYICALCEVPLTDKRFVALHEETHQLARYPPSMIPPWYCSGCLIIVAEIDKYDLPKVRRKKD